jgi:hypothetical protein
MGKVDLYPTLSAVLDYEESAKGLRKQIDEDFMKMGTG